MLAMQVPEGQNVSVPIGDQSASKALELTAIDASHLAFHKVADEVWTGMPLPPHKDDKKRYVGQPSTAATLNLAAIGAQCGRLWKEIDPSFAKRCINAAEKAWTAALAHPDIFAYDNFTGSGPYDDLVLSDEFYWAASELFITTGNVQYRDFLKSSPHYLETPKGNIATDGDIFWQYTAPLGTISLAVVPNNLGKEAISQARANIIQTASNYEAQVTKEGYHIPYSVEEYPWGSNSNLVNRSLFLVYANDFSGEVKFLKAAANAMDYILGANPMNISYVTGYGSHAAQNPHHRFWAKAADKNSPAPAPGALIGGPNSISFSDPIAATMKGQCIGQTCYRDNIGAWSLNEITINWNAPLVWVASALDEGKLH
ncbi:chitinase [Vibrio maritimus]|uniref:Endoglucanase n=1 Tax=Vibrio maritimus TaxID=990268 RepID=A0A090T5A1_9VIBR|nr:chitinase [Vibrio maritimus]